MARIRSLKPEAFQSETLANVSIEAERTFFGLSTQADDRGRFRWQPKTLNGILWSERGDHPVTSFEAELQELQAENAVCRYVGCDGKQYGHLVAWDRHQKVDRPTPSRIPPCPVHQASDRCLFHEGSCPVVVPVESPRRGLTESSRVLATDLDRGSGSGIVDLEKEQQPAAEPRADVQELIEHLHDRIERNGSKRPRVTKTTRDAARLLVDEDKRPLDEAHRLIDWCQAHSFWHAHVLSMAKFREKYQQMFLQARAGPQRAGGGFEPYRNPADQSAYDQDWQTS